MPFFPVLLPRCLLGRRFLRGTWTGIIAVSRRMWIAGAALLVSGWRNAA
jgi:hypothetical protein